MAPSPRHHQHAYPSRAILSCSVDGRQTDHGLIIQESQHRPPPRTSPGAVTHTHAQPEPDTPPPTRQSFAMEEGGWDGAWELFVFSLRFVRDSFGRLCVCCNDTLCYETRVINTYLLLGLTSISAR